MQPEANCDCRATAKEQRVSELSREDRLACPNERGRRTDDRDPRGDLIAIKRYRCGQNYQPAGEKGYPGHPGNLSGNGRRNGDCH
jgi:hypothetical protein